MTKKKTPPVEGTPLILAISKIFIPENIRSPGWDNLDSLKTLAASIKASGLEQPISVCPFPDDQAGPDKETHELVSGFRRYMACKKVLKWTKIPVVLKPKKTSAKDRFVSSMAENDGREDLSPMEEALAFKRAIEEHGMTASEIGKRRGLSSAYISQRMALLKMPEEVQKAMEKEEIKFAHARAMMGLDNEVQVKLLPAATRMKVDDFKQKVATMEGGGKKKKKSNRGRPQKAKVRTVSEVKVELGKLDGKKNTALEKKDSASEQYWKGMMRGLGWAAGMTKTLY